MRYSASLSVGLFLDRPSTVPSCHSDSLFHLSYAAWFNHTPRSGIDAHLLVLSHNLGTWCLGTVAAQASTEHISSLRLRWGLILPSSSPSFLSSFLLFLLSRSFLDRILCSAPYGKRNCSEPCFRTLYKLRLQHTGRSNADSRDALGERRWTTSTTHPSQFPQRWRLPFQASLLSVTQALGVTLRAPPRNSTSGLSFLQRKVRFSQHVHGTISQLDCFGSYAFSVSVLEKRPL